jgi:hypothetical protein
MEMEITLDDIYTKGDVFVAPGKPGETTFIAANKRGRDAVRRVIENSADMPPGSLHTAWRAAGEGWPDTWLGFDFITPDDAQFAALIREEDVSVFHRDEDGAYSYLPANAPCT